MTKTKELDDLIEQLYINKKENYISGAKSVRLIYGDENTGEVFPVFGDSSGYIYKDKQNDFVISRKSSAYRSSLIRMHDVIAVLDVNKNVLFMRSEKLIWPHLYVDNNIIREHYTHKPLFISQDNNKAKKMYNFLMGDRMYPM